MSVQTERRHAAMAVRRYALTLLGLLALDVLASCGTGGTPAPTPTGTAVARVTAVPTATATASQAPATVVPTPVPTRPAPTAPPRPTPTPSRAPTATPASVCVPPPGVAPVSSSLVVFGNTSARQVALTFDAGGEDGVRATQILDTLQTHGLHVTFFLTGDWARAHPDLVRRLVADGHEIGNHTVDHPDLTQDASGQVRSDQFICNELVQADGIISGMSGRSTRPFFRPPYGAYNEQVRTLAARLGYRTIYWSIDPRDWDPATTAQDILNRVLTSPNLKPGAIILEHAGGPNTPAALDALIDGLQQRGYSIVPLSALV
jgi:peptidoglycan-N-acetylglucosamine deacetylase